MADDPEKTSLSQDGLQQHSEEPEEKEAKGSGGDFLRIFKYADKYDWILNATAFSCAIASGAALPLMTLIFGSFTNKFNGDVDSFVLWFVYLFVGKFVVTYVATATISISAIRTTRNLRRAFLECTLRQEVWHFDKQTIGATATQTGIAEKLVFTIQALAMFFASFVVALATQWKLALITMSIIPAIFLVIGARITKIYSRAAVLAEEVLSSIRTKKMLQKYDGNKKCPIYGILFSTEYFCVYSAIALSFWQGFRIVGTVFTVVLSVTIAATSISTLAPQFQSFTNAASAASELFSIIDKPTLLDPLNPEGKQPSTCEGQIEIRNLAFAYPSRPSAQVLHNLDISIPAGKTTALSTLVGLLERWYLPTSGTILLDGIDLVDYNVKWLRSRIRLVQQEPILFRGTVFQNIANGFMANADVFIDELPQGYETEVGERAGTLSARTTSALDPQAEKIVQDALNRVSKNRTTLIIAHKLATVKTADNIAVISQGKILIERDGRYAGLEQENDKIRNEKRALDTAGERVALQRTTTAATSRGGDIEKNTKPLGTLGYSLLRCIFIMFKEQKNLYWWFVLSTIACFIGGATFPAQALLFSRLLTVFELTGHEAQKRADFYSLMFFVVALGNLVAYFAIGWTCNVIGQTVTHRYRAEMFQQVLAQDIEFFDIPENTSGALTSKLSAVPTQLQELISANILLVFIVLVNIVSSSALALAYGWKLGLVVVFGALPPLLIAGYLRIRLENKLEAKNSEAFSESAGLASEAVTSIRTVASLTLESHILDEYSRMLGNVVTRSVRALVWTMFWFSLSQSIEFLAMALGFWYGSRLLASGEYTTSQFYIIFIGVLFAGQAAAQFFGYSTSISKAGGAANYILWLRSLKSTIIENNQNKDNGPDGEGPVNLEDVEFRYRQRDTARVLRGISMTIEPGQYVAYVGASGCGKSTLIALLERFYDPVSGRICLGGKDILEMSPRLYRGHMSLVQQEPTLYQGSVRENVSLGLDFEPSDEQIREACRKANAQDFVVSLPEGFDTPCGSRGMQFSGALIRNPKLLLLDEATSALDTQSERLAAMSRTTIAVAHRLSTIRNANIAEMGTHAELQRLKGRYYEMCLAQSLDQA
ncbi:ATP-binding cassette, subfamily B, member 1 [Exophiala viscosa]|uniref:ATP-binding cassette, subfamily B, member 1 n=1 Tax=Exophiala viscosa TaxID=2486360 RepID=A0AAN6E7Y4_9EURO|nr:ATP-binding cassette, subfamily B, member 1 [Exophiala viscosa]